MEAAGLTHGGFYRHFRSKDDLSAEAVAHGLATSAARRAAVPSLEALVSRCLSSEHRAKPEKWLCDRGAGQRHATVGSRSGDWAVGRGLNGAMPTRSGQDEGTAGT